MARAAHTYRGARRNEARLAKRAIGTRTVSECMMRFATRKHPHPPKIKHRPYNSRGWCWKWGNSYVRRAYIEKMRQARQLPRSALANLLDPFVAAFWEMLSERPFRRPR